MKKFCILFAICLSLCFIGIGAPTKSMLGTELAESHFEEEEEQNLWVWPTELEISRYGNPNTVQYWQIGIWYGVFSYNGYSRPPTNIQNFHFDDRSFHNCREGAGYSMVQFFLLDAGTYDISYSYICETYSDNAFLYFSFYEPDGNGGWIFKFDSPLSLIWRYDEGSYKTEYKRITIPEGVITGITISGMNADGRRGIDVWDVVLKKVD